MYKFSIILPTRQRTASLERFIKSVYNTTNDKSKIEILIVTDSDDNESLKKVLELKEKYKILSISNYTRPRSEWINNDYYNFLASYAKGKFIWVCADDLQFLVNNWDIIIWNKINQYLSNKPDRILCANILDNTPAPGDKPTKKEKEEFPCFPLFSREVLSVLGFLLAPQLPTWCADRYAWNLFTKANRFLVINDQVYIDHIGYHTKVMEADEITTRAGEICAKWATIDKHSYHKQMPTIEQQAKLLRDYINGKMVNA